MQVYNVQVNFACQGHRVKVKVKVKVTGARIATSGVSIKVIHRVKVKTSGHYYASILSTWVPSSPE